MRLWRARRVAFFIQTLWINKKPSDIQIINNRYLYVTVGKAIIKMNIQEQRGDFFSYGDGEPLDYTYEEIEERGSL